jgi:hypothetical protein
MMMQTLKSMNEKECVKVNRMLRKKCKDVPPGTAVKMIKKFLKCNPNEALLIYKGWRKEYLINKEW